MNPNPEHAAVAIVDDDSELAESLASILESRNYTVSTFETAEALMAGIDSDDAPICVVMDGNLPGMDGPEAIGLLTKQQPALAILAVSGQATMREPMLEAGARGFLAKPVDIPEFLQAVAKLAENCHQSPDNTHPHDPTPERTK